MRACRPKSSLIRRIEYDETVRELVILFENGRRYAYADVPPDAYGALCSAQSAGHFYNQRVKGRYACREVGERRRFRPSPDAFRH